MREWIIINKISNEKELKDIEASVKKDVKNQIIEGDPNKIKTVIDHWKFTKKISSSNPNWYLAEIKNT